MSQSGAGAPIVSGARVPSPRHEVEEQGSRARVAPEPPGVHEDPPATAAESSSIDDRHPLSPRDGVVLNAMAGAVGTMSQPLHAVTDLGAPCGMLICSCGHGNGLLVVGGVGTLGR